MTPSPHISYFIKDTVYQEFLLLTEGSFFLFFHSDLETLAKILISSHALCPCSVIIVGQRQVPSTAW